MESLTAQSINETAVKFSYIQISHQELLQPYCYNRQITQQVRLCGCTAWIATTAPLLARVSFK